MNRANGGTGAMIALFVPYEVGSRIALPDGLPVEELHLTLLYLGEASEIRDKDLLIQAVEGFAAAHEPLAGVLNGLARFVGDPDSDVVVALYDAVTLPGFRHELLEAITLDSSIEPVFTHGFIPHITLAYIKPGDELPAEILEPIELTFGAISLELGDERHTFPLGVDRGKNRMSGYEILWGKIKGLFEPLLQERAWDGSASRWETADDYCKSCLISVWKEAGLDEPTKSHCKLPVRAPGSSAIDPEGLQAAAGGRGITAVTKPSDVSQEDWDKAVKAAANTIISNYPKLLDKNAPDSVYELAGKEIPMERAIPMGDIFSRVYQVCEAHYPMAWLHDIYADADGSLFAILSHDGHLYRSPLMIEGDEVTMGEWQMVVQEFRPVEMRSTTKIIRQADGRTRWVSVSATSVLNRVGEIDSRALFDSFVAYAESTGQYPYRTFYHQGEAFRTGQADFLARDKNVYITSGLYDDSDIARAEVAALESEPDFWGESIGYLPTSEPAMVRLNGIAIPVYRSGINTEISTLPERDAANLFTVVRTEVQRMLTGKAYEAFIKLMGDEEKARKWLAENADGTNRAIEQAGMITRASASSATETTTEETAEIEVDDDLLDAVIQRMAEAGPFADLLAQMGSLAEGMQTVNQSQADMIAGLQTLEKDITGRLAKLERGKEVERQEWVADLPAKPTVRTYTYRPRGATQPQDEQPETSSDRVKKTLEKLPTY